ncbi:NAD-dependent epimerase/dehydratase family protein [bacterium]|nr:NAD-dependent epimerase/dehydratase family protein [bacterium]
MKILIIGGTCFIGPYVVRRLAAAGHDLLLFHRGKHQIELADNMRQVLGDRGQLPSYQAELCSFAPELIIDMIPIRESDVITLLDVFKGTSRRLLVISSQDAYRAYGLINRTEDGPLQPVPITETDDLRTRLYPYRGLNQKLDDYDKILVERVALSSQSIRGTVLRLPMVYGPQDYQHRLFPYLRRMQDKRSFILLGAGEAQWRWSHGYVENVAEAVALAVENERACGQIFNVAEPFFFTREDWVRTIGQRFNWQGRILVVPDDELPETFREKSRVEQDLIVDSTKIRRELGYRETVTVEEALDRTIAWERDNPPGSYDPKAFDYQAEDEVLAELIARRQVSE